MTEQILQIGDVITALDQVRAIDISRIVAYRGSLTTQEYAAIAKSLQQIMKPD